MNPTIEPALSAEPSSPPPNDSTTSSSAAATVPASGQDSMTGPQQLEETELFEQLRMYPFVSDQEFAKGLSIILGHPESPASEEEITRDDDLVLQAKCYYFARKEKLTSSLNVASYKTWLKARPDRAASVDQTPRAEPREHDASTAYGAPLSGNTSQQSVPAQQEPTYPTSFAHIVELITTGQPIPGIQQIPDTVLAGQDTPSTKPRRRKPWEKEESSEVS